MYRDIINKKKNLNNVSSAKYDKTSIWFVTLAISIADNWALDTIKIRLPRLIIGQYESNFATVFDHFISQLKKTGRRGEVIMAVGGTL